NRLTTTANYIPSRKLDGYTTTRDLTLKIGIMYDGEHHLQRKQRDRDSRINVESSLQGWVIIRVTAGTLASSASYLKRMIEMRR
ncbi:hypothetical protein QP951_09370, partial [Corynebacterium appendicis]|nr:hypothetical protein [Corynebacterium appendicis]